MVVILKTTTMLYSVHTYFVMVLLDVFILMADFCPLGYKTAMVMTHVFRGRSCLTVLIVKHACLRSWLNRHSSHAKGPMKNST